MGLDRPYLASVARAGQVVQADQAGLASVVPLARAGSLVLAVSQGLGSVDHQASVGLVGLVNQEPVEHLEDLVRLDSADRMGWQANQEHQDLAGSVVRMAAEAEDLERVGPLGSADTLEMLG